MNNFSQSICNITILVFVILIIYFSFFKNKDKNNNLKENFFDGQFVSDTSCISNDGAGTGYNAYAIPKNEIGGPMISSGGRGIDNIYNESANSLLNKCKQLANYKHGESGYSGITVASERNERGLHSQSMGCTIFHGQKQQLRRNHGVSNNEIEKSCYINPNYAGLITEEKVCKTEEGNIPGLELDNGDDRQDTNSVKYIHDETKCKYKGCLKEDAINKANMPSSGRMIDSEYNCEYEEKVCKTEEGNIPGLELDNGDDRQDTNSVKYIHDETKCKYKGCLKEDAINKANMPSSGRMIDSEYNCIYPEQKEVCKESEALYKDVTEYNLKLINGNTYEDTETINYFHKQSSCKYKGCWDENATNTAKKPPDFSGIIKCVTDNPDLSGIDWNDSDTGEWSDNDYKFWEAGDANCSDFDHRPDKCFPSDGEKTRVVKDGKKYKTCKFDRLTRDCNYSDITWNIEENDTQEFYEGEYIEEKPRAYLGDLELEVYKSNDTIINKDSVPEEYKIEYSAQYNDIESSITKTVIIKQAEDDLAPTIELNGEAHITIVQGEIWNDPKATASDNMDGDIPPERINVSGTVDTETISTYTLGYWVTDNAGNTSRIINRTVEVIAPPDTIPPQIALFGKNPMEIYQGDEFVEPGFRAVDETGWDLVEDVVIGGDIVDNTNPGDYNIKYSIPESKYGPASDIITRTVTVKKRIDKTPPTIILNGESIVRLELGQPYDEPGVTAETHAGNSIEDVIISGDEVDKNTEDIYYLKYRVIDPESNVSSETLVRLVIVEKTPDINAPELTILGSADMEISVGSRYIDAGATAWDNNGDGNITENIIPYGVVNPNIANTYVITYVVYDSAGNSATAKRTVTVSRLPDERAPILELFGDNPMRIIIGSSYIEEGGQAVDNNGKNLTENIETDNTNLNTDELGEYEVIYTVSDGFRTTQKIRKVIVYSRGRDLCNETILEKPCEEMSKDECGGLEGVSGIYDGQQAFHCDWNSEEDKCVQGWGCGERPPNPPPPTEEEWLQKVGHKYQ